MNNVLLLFTISCIVIIATFTVTAASSPSLFKKLHGKNENKQEQSSSCKQIIDDHYPRQYVALRAQSPPAQIDGDITKPFWNEPGVEWTEDFIDISTSAIPQLRTRAKIRFDDEYLYVAGHLEDSHVCSNITACCHCINASQDQVVFHGNDFEFFCDADSTTHYYKEFEGSPAGGAVYWDICLNKPYQDGGYENSSRVLGQHGFDMFPELKYQVKVLGGGQLNDPSSYPLGWTTEIAFPLNKLLLNTTREGKKPKAGDFWRINFSRVQWGTKIVDGRYWMEPSCTTCGNPSNPTQVLPGQKTCDNWVYQKIGVIDIHVPELWAFLQLADNATTPKIQNLEWPARYAAHVLYYALRSYHIKFAKFTDSIPALINGGFAEYPELLIGDCTKTPIIELSGDMQHYVATIGSNEVPGMNITVNDVRLTQAHYA